MSANKPHSDERDHWFSDAQLAKVAPADETDDWVSPIPTQMVSNGEYMPIAQTAEQKRVEQRLKELADKASKKLGMTRRRFLASSGGMAAGFLAMNDVFGRFFKVAEAEMYEPAAFAGSGVPPRLFVLDDQLHIIRSSWKGPGNQIRAIAMGMANPASNPLVNAAWSATRVTSFASQPGPGNKEAAREWPLHLSAATTRHS